MEKLKSGTYKFQSWLYQPYKVFIVSICILAGSLILNGTVWKVVGLYRDEAKFNKEIKKAQLDAQALTAQMTVVRDPRYIEHLAKDKMDLVGENDLMFVFPN